MGLAYKQNLVSRFITRIEAQEAFLRVFHGQAVDQTGPKKSWFNTSDVNNRLVRTRVAPATHGRPCYRIQGHLLSLPIADTQLLSSVIRFKSQALDSWLGQ